MAIYIKGMEMPKDYSVIVKIFPDGRVGTIPYVQWFKVDLIPGTHAVPVPPHGRLIEESKVLYIVSEWCPDDDGSVGKVGDLREMLDEIEALPTIIPAEEGET